MHLTSVASACASALSATWSRFQAGNLVCAWRSHPEAVPLPLLRSFLPHIGRVTIIMNDYPWFKYALIAALGVVVLTSKDG